MTALLQNFLILEGTLDLEGGIFPSLLLSNAWNVFFLALSCPGG
jgi:hypothetical protein